MKFIQLQKPDIIAVCGTSVIKPKIFTLSQKGTINIHCGITPEYRSADPVFWALYNNEPDKVGVTIHYVDEGIDTGDIIYQEPVEVTRDDNLSILYCKCIKTGAELMVKAIDDIEHGNVKTVRKDSISGKAYYHMDLGIWQHFLFQRKFKKMKRSLKAL
jgi:methionyl-tRNA formyltransferase